MREEVLDKPKLPLHLVRLLEVPLLVELSVGALGWRADATLDLQRARRDAGAEGQEESERNEGGRVHGGDGVGDRE